MGEISVSRHDLERLLVDSAGTYGAPYQQAFADLARTHRGRAVADILPPLRRAADHALLGFSRAELREQARAIRNGEPYVLRITVT